MEVPDLPQAMLLKEAANWNQTGNDWKMLAGLPGAHLVAERDGKIVGTIAALDYVDFVWVAMVLVHPNNRRQGIASQLMQKVLDLFPDRILRLDATADGSKVYENFHFREEYRLSRWRLTPSSRSKYKPSGDIHQTKTAISDIIRSDVPFFGGNREQLLASLGAINAPITHHHQDSGQISYLFFRPGIHAWQIGPIVALDKELAINLIKKCLSVVADQPFFIDIPDNENWMQAIHELGFRKERLFIRMQFGGWNRIASPHEFAIAGPEFG